MFWDNVCTYIEGVHKEIWYFVLSKSKAKKKNCGKSFVVAVLFFLGCVVFSL